MSSGGSPAPAPRVLREAVALDTPVIAPFVGAALGARLHLFTSGPDAPAEHFAVDADGNLRVHAHPLRTPPVYALASSGAELFLACAGRGATGAGQPSFTRTDASGVPVHQVPVPVRGPLVHWPRPAYQGDTATAAWTSGSPRHDLWTCVWTGTGPPIPVHAGTPDGAVTSLELAGGPGGALLASATARSVELRRLRGDGSVDATNTFDLGQRVQILRVCAVGTEWWMIWLGEGRPVPLLRRFGADLHPLCPPLPLGPPPPARGRVRDVQLLAEAPDRVAVSITHALPLPGPVIGRSGAGQPVRAHGLAPRAFLGACARDGSLSELTELTEPGQGPLVLGWLGKRLVVVHGPRQPLVTALTWQWPATTPAADPT